jgi:signal transduction histidine kinase
VIVRASRRDREAVVSVIDCGAGIPSHALPHVFERFYRDPTRTSLDGFGLGLYITRLIAEAHGGRVWAESEVGAGCTFSLALTLD